MNFTFRNFSVRHKSSNVLSEFLYNDKRNFDFRVTRASKEGNTCQNNSLTSNQTDKKNVKKRNLSQTEFKVMNKNKKLTPDDPPPVLQYIKRVKKKYQGYISKDRLTSNNTSVEDYIYRKRYKIGDEAINYTVLKRRFSTFTNNFYINPTIFKENENSKNTGSASIKVVKQKHNSTESEQNIPKFHNHKSAHYKIIKNKKTASNLKIRTPKDETLKTELSNVEAEIKQNQSNKNESIENQGIENQCNENQCIENKNKENKNEKNEDNENNNDNLRNDDHRENEINLQMLPPQLYKQVFPEENSDFNLLSEKLDSIKQELKSFGLDVNNQTHLPNVNIELPSLEGKNIEEHFYNIANSQSKPYLKVVNDLIRKIPPVPEKWIFQEGWTKYTESGAEKVDYPAEDGLIFDVEVCVSEGPLPTLATAVSKNAWYGWVSKSLVEGSSAIVKDLFLSADLLIPVESNFGDYGKKLNSFQRRPKVIVGHNVSYDRGRIKEQYWLTPTGTRFIDTMSMHVCVSGINSFQRALLKSDKEDLEENLRHQSSLNNLADVHQLYCGQKIDKKSRDLFVEGTLSQVREQFDDMMKYCASDVQATFNILKSLFPMFQQRFPHPVTFAGMLELGSAYLPVNSNWQRYIEESESTFQDLSHESKVILSNRAAQVCRLMHDEKYKEDLWMWDQDWSTQKIKMKIVLTKAQREEMLRNQAEEKKRIERRKEREKKERETEKQAEQEKQREQGKQTEQEQEKQIKTEQQTEQEKQIKIEKRSTRIETENTEKQKLEENDEEMDPLAEKFAYLNNTKYFLPLRMPHMPGYPNWYRKLCLKKKDEDWVPGAQNISTSMKVAPKILNLTWENYPLHYIKEHGWGFLVPYNDDLSIETKIPLKQLLEQCPLPIQSNSQVPIDHTMATLRSDVQDDLHKSEFWRAKKQKHPDDVFYKGSGVWCNVDMDNCCWFFKLPHKDGISHNVGNPLAKDFLNKFSDNILAGLDVSATSVLKIARMLSYWRNNRDRIMSQVVIWFDEDTLPSVLKKDKRKMRYGAILPQVVVSGTLTRRAVEPTWMTASNAHAERIGSELRAMIQAPPGYNIVGADVDSQELWIASVIGDAHHAKIHGATPFGWMTLIGNKANGTDMHSVTAKAIGISRDHAKVINYARIYGAGQRFAERLLKQFNPSMTEAEAASKSQKMFSMTKGRKVYRLKKEFISKELSDKEYSAGLMFKIAKIYGRPAGEMFEKGQWIGGSESAMFNRLEEIAGSRHPVTPFLNSRLSRALEVEQVDDDKYLPTKVNWVVQSGAVDFLHLMLVSMRWLMRDNARFCLSFHDEIRYLVSSKYKYNAALAMHITNLLTRGFCSSRLGIRDLPMSVAFFTSVEVDTVLRKESSLDCKTPSNPHGLEAGYEISSGESLDVWKAIEKSAGSLGSWHNKSRVNLDPNLASKEDTQDDIQM